VKVADSVGASFLFISVKFFDPAA